MDLHFNYYVCFPIFYTGQTSSSTTPGFAEYSIEFNAPPTPGTCHVDPGEGYALQTTFTITCQGFSDVDTPLSYQIYAYSTVQVINGELYGDGEGTNICYIPNVVLKVLVQSVSLNSEGFIDVFECSCCAISIRWFYNECYTLKMFIM